MRAIKPKKRYHVVDISDPCDSPATPAPLRAFRSASLQPLDAALAPAGLPTRPAAGGQPADDVAGAIASAQGDVSDVDGRDYVVQVVEDSLGDLHAVLAAGVSECEQPRLLVEPRGGGGGGQLQHQHVRWVEDEDVDDAVPPSPPSAHPGIWARVRAGGHCVVAVAAHSRPLASVTSTRHVPIS